MSSISGNLRQTKASILRGYGLGSRVLLRHFAAIAARRQRKMDPGDPKILDHFTIHTGRAKSG